MSNKLEQNYSVVSINFESKTQPGLHALYMAMISATYPESLAEAILAGTKSITERHGDFLFKPVQWMGMNINFTIPSIEPVTEVVDKNDLMKEIIENKDKKLLEKYSIIFTKNEKKLIKDMWKSKKTKKTKTP